jgi:hypothetical protein
MSRREVISGNVFRITSGIPDHLPAYKKPDGDAQGAAGEINRAAMRIRLVMMRVSEIALSDFVVDTAHGFERVRAQADFVVGTAHGFERVRAQVRAIFDAGATMPAASKMIRGRAITAQKGYRGGS